MYYEYETFHGEFMTQLVEVPLTLSWKRKTLIVNQYFIAKVPIGETMATKLIYFNIHNQNIAYWAAMQYL